MSTTTSLLFLRRFLRQTGLSSKISTMVLSAVVGIFSLLLAANTHAEEGDPPGLQTLKIGDPAPDFTLLGTDGKQHSLKDYAGPDVLMVIFVSNHCPTSHAIEKRLLDLIDAQKGRSFGVVAINPNTPEGMTPQEHSYGVYTDSYEHMKPYAESVGWKFDYLFNGDKQDVAKAYGCLATPHVFLFDRERKLRYAGRFDDSRIPAAESVKSPDAKNAVEALFAGKPVPVELTKPHGCSTKWREKAAIVKADEEKWQKLPVVLDTLDAAGAKTLRENKGGKYRLINLWATWCAPCVEEFPQFVRLQREVSLRPFEFLSISLDAPTDTPKVQAFLEKKHAVVPANIQKTVEAEGRKTNHYLFTGASQDDLMAALDPQWPGPLPHTLLIDPQGKIAFRHTGKISAEDLKAKVIAVMGPYWESAGK